MPKDMSVNPAVYGPAWETKMFTSLVVYTDTYESLSMA